MILNYQPNRSLHKSILKSIILLAMLVLMSIDWASDVVLVRLGAVLIVFNL
jgi:hypothetical protein